MPADTNSDDSSSAIPESPQEIKAEAEALLNKVVGPKGEDGRIYHFNPTPKADGKTIVASWEDNYNRGNFLLLATDKPKGLRVMAGQILADRAKDCNGTYSSAVTKDGILAKGNIDALRLTSTCSNPGAYYRNYYSLLVPRGHDGYWIFDIFNLKEAGDERKL